MRAVATASFLAVLFATGCNVGEGRIVGKWEPSTQLDQVKGDEPGDRLLKGLGGLAKAVGPNIEFRADHTFSMALFFTIEGRWQMNGNTVTCTPEKVSGIAIDAEGKKAQEPFSLTLSADGSKLSSDQRSQSSFTLVRSKAG